MAGRVLAARQPQRQVERVRERAREREGGRAGGTQVVGALMTRREAQWLDVMEASLQPRVTRYLGW